MVEVPLVNLIEDLRLDDPLTAGELTYRNLASAALRYEQAEAAFEASVDAPDLSPIQKLHAERNATSAQIVRDAYKATIATTEEARAMWTRRATRGSIELYGQPDPQEARQLIHGRQNQLLALQSSPKVDQRHVDFLLNFYTSVVGEPDPGVTNTKIEIPYKDEISRELYERFGPVFEILESTAAGKDVLTSKEYAGAMRGSLTWLARHHSREWKNWNVVLREGGYATYQETKEIIAGQNPAGVTRLRAVTLQGHEILGHTLASVIAYQRGDHQSAIGLPGFEKSGEGWSTLLGWVASDTTSTGAIDLYTDIVLSMGSIDGQPRSREELLKVSLARAIINEQLETDSFDLDPDTQQRVGIRVNQGINRISRIGLPTKDSIYHGGFRQVADLITWARGQGIKMNRIFDYFSLGGFDPYIDVHREHVFQSTGQKLSIHPLPKNF